MISKIGWRTRFGVLAVAGALVAGACGAGATTAPITPAPGGTPGAGTPAPAATPAGLSGQKVSVIGTWGGDEEKAFLAMVAPWETKTGAKVAYTGTRDLNAVLTTGVASGILPDLAGLPGPGQMAEFAKAGKLVDLSTVLDTATYKADTAPAFVDLGTVDGKIAGVFIKSAVKGLIWYNKSVFTGTAPTTWDALAATPAAPAKNLWCIALESGAASGWPGTDWIEDIVLRQAGPAVYDGWVAGTQKWTSAEIKAAFETFGKAVADSYGGKDYILNTNFGDGGNQLFTTPPGCLFHHQASFITSFFEKQGGAKPGTYDFFPFPDINPANAGSLTGAGDLFGMFHDTPAAKSLMAYLVTPEAQQIWVDKGGALSGNKKVTKYPDPVSQRSAELLVNAKTFRFDASDLMPKAMNDAFWTAILNYVSDPTKLDSILTSLDATQKDAYGL
jgi:alpha-glucoside transport system substrate-binding protein